MPLPGMPLSSIARSKTQPRLSRGVRKTVKQVKGVTFRGHAFYIKRVAAFVAQEVQPLTRNAVTQYTPDIQVSGESRLAERTYVACPV